MTNVYDNADRQTSLTIPNTLSENYVYDNADQLTAINYKDAAVTTGTIGYGNDLLGRETQQTGSYARTGLPAGFTAVYDSANRQTSYTPAGGSAATQTMIRPGT